MNRPAPPPRVPRIVVDDACAPVARILLGAAGRERVAPDGWTAPHQVVEVDATTSAGVQAAVRAALAGRGVLAEVSDETLSSVVADLGAIGEVEAWVAGAPDLPAVVRLAPEQVGVLVVLATGGSTGDAAEAHHLSQRSVERRLKDARTTLGVGSVAEAVVEVSRALARWRVA